MDSRGAVQTRILDCGLVVVAPAQHADGKRRLVHQLKYQASHSAARKLGVAIAAVVPTEVTVLVPVPRALLRKMRYGVDPAYELARVVGRELDLPVRQMLAASLWWRAHVGSSRDDRKTSARLRSRSGISLAGEYVALIDDVVTTGGTLACAARCLDESGNFEQADLVGLAATLA